MERAELVAGAPSAVELGGVGDNSVAIAGHERVQRGVDGLDAVGHRLGQLRRR